MKFTLSVAMLDPAQVLPLAVCADELGYDAIAVPDSPFFPEKVDVPYPYLKRQGRFWGPETPWLEPWVVIPAMAALTKQIRFYTNVLKLPIRHPLFVAKTVGSAAVLSNNRVGLGVGLSWIPEEFKWCGSAWETRGARADEAIEIIQALLHGGMVEYHGKHYDFDRLQMSPAPTAPVPIYVGGHSEPALRRAARLGDGWCSAFIGADELAKIVVRLGELRASFGREKEPFEIQSTSSFITDVSGFQRCVDIGVTDVVTQPWYFYGGGPQATLEEKKDGLKRFADEVFPKMRA